LLVDAHAHLDDPVLLGFARKITFPQVELTVITNSVDVESSERNIELGKSSPKIIPFVGIHPEIFRGEDKLRLNIEMMIQTVSSLASASKGIGEIGMDPKYGHIESQEPIFLSMLSLAERTGLPVSIHSRDSVPRIIEILSTFNLKGSILFHWFAGSDSELVGLRDRGIFISYGPAILFSKRMGKLVEESENELIISETDSPTAYSSLGLDKSSPFLIATTVFKLSLIKKKPFPEMEQILWENVSKYLRTQTSLRVKEK